MCRNFKAMIYVDKIIQNPFYDIKYFYWREHTLCYIWDMNAGIHYCYDLVHLAG
jgi:hypothetical protein